MMMMIMMMARRDWLMRKAITFAHVSLLYYVEFIFIIDCELFKYNIYMIASHISLLHACTTAVVYLNKAFRLLGHSSSFIHIT